jgi:hypothetical protein
MTNFSTQCFILTVASLTKEKMSILEIANKVEQRIKPPLTVKNVESSVSKSITILDALGFINRNKNKERTITLNKSSSEFEFLINKLQTKSEKDLELLFKTFNKASDISDASKVEFQKKLKFPLAKYKLNCTSVRILLTKFGFKLEELENANKKISLLKCPIQIKYKTYETSEASIMILKQRLESGMIKYEEIPNKVLIKLCDL